MPAKRRASKRRADAAPAWSVLFETGHDYFGDLRPFGIHDDATAHAGAREAWAQFGDAFLRGRDPLQQNRAQPWALEEFGKPSTRR